MRGLDPPGAVIVGLAMQEALTVVDRTARGVGHCLRPAVASSGRVQRADRLPPNKVISVNRSHSSLTNDQRNTGPFYGRRCPDRSDSAVKCGQYSGSTNDLFTVYADGTLRLGAPGGI